MLNKPLALKKNILVSRTHTHDLRIYAPLPLSIKDTENRSLYWQTAASFRLVLNTLIFMIIKFNLMFYVHLLYNSYSITYKYFMLILIFENNFRCAFLNTYTGLYWTECYKYFLSQYFFKKNSLRFVFVLLYL